MDIRVQSPVIGSALRDALNLAAAGGMPLFASDTIVPVAVVANVEDQVQQNRVDGWQLAIGNATAAQYTYATLEWQAAGIDYGTEYVEVHGVWLNSATAQRVYIGQMAAPAITSTVGLPQIKRGSQVASALSCRAGTSSTASIPTTFLPRLAGQTVLPVNTPIYHSFNRPIILDQPGQALVVIGSTVNLELYASFEWEEYRRP